MSNNFLMLRAHFVIAVLSLVFALPAQASTIYDLVATPDPGDASLVSGFTIRFDDVNADTRLNIGEIISFSGLTFYPISTPAPSYFYNQIISIPVVFNIDATQQLSNYGHTSSSCFSPYGGAPWLFVNCTGTVENYPSYSFSEVVWNYNLTGVPIPQTLWLFGSGVFGLLGLERCENVVT